MSSQGKPSLLDSIVEPTILQLLLPIYVTGYLIVMPMDICFVLLLLLPCKLQEVTAFSSPLRYSVGNVIETLSNNGVRSPHKDRYESTTGDVVQVLQQLESSKSFMNKSNLLHEIEEAIVALDCLKRFKNWRYVVMKP